MPVIFSKFNCNIIYAAMDELHIFFVDCAKTSKLEIFQIFE